MWPDIGKKSSPNFSKTAQIVSTVFLLKKWCLSKLSEMSPHILATYLCKKLSPKASKIAQSGHTGYFSHLLFFSDKINHQSDLSRSVIIFSSASKFRNYTFLLHLAKTLENFFSRKSWTYWWKNGLFNWPFPASFPGISFKKPKQF